MTIGARGIAPTLYGSAAAGFNFHMEWTNPVAVPARQSLLTGDYSDSLNNLSDLIVLGGATQLSISAHSTAAGTNFFVYLLGTNDDGDAGGQPKNHAFIETGFVPGTPGASSLWFYAPKRIIWGPFDAAGAIGDEKLDYGWTWPVAWHGIRFGVFTAGDPQPEQLIRINVNRVLPSSAPTNAGT